MPDSVMSLFPQVTSTLKGVQNQLQSGVTLAEMAARSTSLGFDFFKNALDMALGNAAHSLPEGDPKKAEQLKQFFEVYQEGVAKFMEMMKNSTEESLVRFRKERQAEMDFLSLFTEEPIPPEWTVESTGSKVLLDLPGMRLIDISLNVDHQVQNYGIVFAPRAGHHSNIAERVALHLRDSGLTRMAIVEQKCAADIPLYVEGKRHHENFTGQVAQYKAMLSHLKGITGYPPHLIAICQPGPLLMTTLILNPELGKTFGSAGSPMNTEGERGFLTDYSRLMGEGYIDLLINLFSEEIPAGNVGAGRKIYDGRLQVLGFYILGMDQHMRNFRKLYSDLRSGDQEAAERQKEFYQWYNYVLHFPAGFIRDTFKKIFVNNELIRGTLQIGDKTVGVMDYPSQVPIWALGGSKDDIAPPLQATGHMPLLAGVPERDKLNIVTEAGHMGLFRSRKVLKECYSKVAEFLLERSDKVNFQ